MPKHSSTNYYKAEAELSDTSVSFLTLESENNGFEYFCVNYSYLAKGCNCSECRESRQRKRDIEIVEKEFTAEQMLVTFLEHVEKDEQNTCSYIHSYFMDDLQKQIKQWYFKHSMKQIMPKPFEGLILHASDLPSCVIDILVAEYEANLREQNKERNRLKRERQRKKRGICEEGKEWTSV